MVHKEKIEILENLLKNWETIYKEMSKFTFKNHTWVMCLIFNRMTDLRDKIEEERKWVDVP